MFHSPSEMKPDVVDIDEPIEIVDYDPAWPALFTQERQRLRFGLGEVTLGIEHFGSTAVPAMAGKPIVDLLGVSSLPVPAHSLVSSKPGGRMFSTYSQAKAPFLAALAKRAEQWQALRSPL
jgi:GrpB-like predicted nucleotidyltransferase (UPF0157 family)